jgi:hypothetical protein
MKVGLIVNFFKGKYANNQVHMLKQINKLQAYFGVKS